MAETSQMCIRQSGKQFTCAISGNEKVAEFVQGRNIECFELFRDRRNSAVGHCYIGEENLAARLVLEGWLIADRDFTLMYLPEEYYSRLLSRGLWKHYQKHPLDYIQDRKNLLSKMLGDPRLQKMLKDLTSEDVKPK